MSFRSLLCAAVALCAFFPTLSHAQSFEDALAAAYARNPGLEARRAALRATDEGVNEALSGYRPDITATSAIGRSQQKIEDGGLFAGSGTLSPRDVGVNIKQPLFKGFRTQAAVSAAQAQVEAGRATLQQDEQALLFEAAQSYYDVLESQSIVELTRANEKVLHQQVEATHSRFTAGEVTKTDISQSDARLSAATASRTRAEGTLANDRATFMRLTGEAPVALTPPALTLPLPENTDDALAQAEQNNPALIAARYGHTAAQADITKAQGALLPEVNLEGRVGRAWDQDLMIPSRQDEATIMARVTIPLYRTGADYARTRAAQQTTVQKRLELEETRRMVRESVLRSWQNLKTAQAAIAAFESEQKANELALHGVQEESKVGTRTTLDVLNARQELLTAQVNLVKARHDEVVARLQLKAALGGLTPEALKLSIKAYDPAGPSETK